MPTDYQTFLAMKNEVQQLKQLSEENSKTIKHLTESNQKLIAEARAQRFREEICGRSKGGVRWLGDHAKHLSFLENLAQKFGEDHQMVKDYIEQQRTHAKRMAGGGSFVEIGNDGNGLWSDNPTSQLDALVQKKMAESGGQMNYAEALGQVSREHPRLYVEHVGGVTVAAGVG